MFDTKPQTRGLSAYAKVRHFRPVTTFLNLFEAILSLFGLTILALWLLSGSFEKAGFALDQIFHSLLKPILSLFSA